MKRYVLIALVLALAAGGCQKKEGPKTTEVSVTVPPAPGDVLSPEPDTSGGLDVALPPVPEPEPTPPAPIPPAPRTHTVQKGDTLWSLARIYLGDPKRWKEIVEANPGLKPEALPIGKTIVIPEK